MTEALNTKLTTIAAQAAAALAIGYAVVVLLAYLLQARLLYLPHVPGRTVTATPADLGLDYEALRLTTEDGVRLSGWFVPAARAAAPVLLFFHGNAGNISHRLESLRVFHELGLATLIIDYRGYGASTGEPSERGTYLDAEAAWSYLVGQRGLPPARIVVSGRSLGAAVAARLAAEHRPAALVLESPFRSVPSLAAELYPWLPVRWLTRFSYEVEAAMGAIDCPVLVVHGLDDEIIPVAHGRAVYAAAASPKQFLALKGGHNDAVLVDHARYTEGLAQFIARHAGLPAGAPREAGR